MPKYQSHSVGKPILINSVRPSSAAGFVLPASFAYVDITLTFQDQFHDQLTSAWDGDNVVLEVFGPNAQGSNFDPFTHEWVTLNVPDGKLRNGSIRDRSAVGTPDAPITWPNVAPFNNVLKSDLASAWEGANIEIELQKPNGSSVTVNHAIRLLTQVNVGGGTGQGTLRASALQDISVYGWRVIPPFRRRKLIYDSNFPPVPIGVTDSASY